MQLLTEIVKTNQTQLRRNHHKHHKYLKQPCISFEAVYRHGIRRDRREVRRQYGRRNRHQQTVSKALKQIYIGKQRLPVVLQMAARYQCEGMGDFHAASRGIHDH